jgi:hypothetical protein
MGPSAVLPVPDQAAYSLRHVRSGAQMIHCPSFCTVRSIGLRIRAGLASREGERRRSR